jgi:hypothetical protein
MSSLDDLEDLFDDLSFDGPTNIQMVELYGIYLNDIANNPIVINGKILKFNGSKSSHPLCRGKHQCFEHIITRESKYSGKRNFDVERTNKIHWIKPILENIQDPRIKYFEAINDKGFNQLFFWYQDKGFIIIIREVNPDLLLITSFSVDKLEKTNYKMQYEKYIEEQKKTPLRK